MHHFCGFAGPPQCATRVAHYTCPTASAANANERALQPIRICAVILSLLLPFLQTPKAILDRFLQGESVAESGAIISHYSRTYFSLYVVPRGLIAELSLHTMPHMTCCTWWAPDVLYMKNTCVAHDEHLMCCTWRTPVLHMMSTWCVVHEEHLCCTWWAPDVLYMMSNWCVVHDEHLMCCTWWTPDVLYMMNTWCVVHDEHLMCCTWWATDV